MKEITEKVKIKTVDEIDFNKAKQPLKCEVEMNGDFTWEKGEGFYKHHSSLFIDGDGGEFWEYYELSKRNLSSLNGKYVEIEEYSYNGDFLFYFCYVGGIDRFRRWEGSSNFGSEITKISI